MDSAGRITQLTLIIPTINEGDNLKTLLARLDSTETPCKISVLVVDDGSKDDTVAVARNFVGKRITVTPVEGPRKGLGAAYGTGVNLAISQQADFIGQMDADLSHEPEAIARLIQPLLAGADIVIGSRYILGGSLPANWALHRIALSVLGNRFVCFLTGYHTPKDWTTGYKLYKVNVAKSIFPRLGKIEGYTFNAAFLLFSLKEGFSVAEVPIDFRDRGTGKSKMRSTDYIFGLMYFLVKQRFSPSKVNTGR
ncbi:MAG: glycosyltransferase [Verrucomicrobiota bacterium]|nr:glycosyltransferase [Verrucomicrobiota bacterium]